LLWWRPAAVQARRRALVDLRDRQLGAAFAQARGEQAAPAGRGHQADRLPPKGAHRGQGEQALGGGRIGDMHRGDAVAPQRAAGGLAHRETALS